METLATLAYLLAAVLFIFGLKRLSKVRTARQGNLLAGVGMLLAMVTVLVTEADISWGWIIAGLVIGGAIGAVAAIKVQMTAMPEMVALFNGSGGIASALVALSFFFLKKGDLDGGTLATALEPGSGPTLALSIIIGGVTFTGSIIAYAKLAGRITSAPVLLPARHFLNIGLVVAALGIGALAAFAATSPTLIGLLLFVLLAAVFVLGVLLVIPIGGADMPVVISLLNSYSGLAASMTGFVLGEPVLIICGALVGAAGLILTQLMCKAMNRSLANVLFGGFGVADSTGKGGREGYTNVKEASPEEAAMLLEDAQSVIFAPGYGLAVAQAQHACKQLGTLLEGRGAKVTYAIHPVAGRMPGHMNVLLAEADVPYEQLLEMDEINPDFKNTDVVIILGANDVVNPAALTDQSSPIWGMPILHVHEARTVFMVKRSLSPGFAGIKNELFENENTLMVFGDAKQVLLSLVEELQNA
ncbi:MAG: NAD(P)(+) transhydrogenase (Re/Si-specific) subunit beta [Planctomycetota bacterium]|jgi:NAD(P) transhydrogenase subunit beta